MSQAGITFISEDIVQVQIPLPYILNIVNVYLLRGPGGWTLLDTGLNSPAARSQWKSAMNALDISPDQIEKIVLTHMHPDHFGMAGWWQRQTEEPIPLFLPETERAQAQVFYQRANSPLYLQWMLDCGMDQATVSDVESAMLGTRDLTQPHPIQQSYLEADARLQLGERAVRAIHAPGHSDGQFIFYDEEEGILFCGDHVLMKITPNIGSWPHSQADPLGRYLESLRDLSALPVRLALPGHRWLISDWSGRIEELLAHHDLRLQQTLEAIAMGRQTVYDIAAHLFNLDRLTAHEWRFAMAEALAHLNYLSLRGKIVCDDAGVMRWRLA